MAMMLLLAAACSATPSWVPLESAQPAGGEDTDPTGDDRSAAAAATDTGSAPDALAFADGDIDADAGPDQASEGFCTSSANIWVHSAALNLASSHANVEINKIALANVAEWLERSTLATDDEVASRVAMFTAFSQLRATVVTDFGSDWQAFQASTAYANDPAAQQYEMERDALVRFLSARCDDIALADLRAEAEDRADTLTAEFAATPSTVVASDSLPGHSIFTHGSGRLIVSFPTAWEHIEPEPTDTTVLVQVVAAPDVDRFLGGEAIDGIHIQLVKADSLDAFGDRMAATTTATDCTQVNELSDRGVVRDNITRTFECGDHGASIVAQYDESLALGLIIEAGFDRLEASRADLIRLASIANSALWS